MKLLQRARTPLKFRGVILSLPATKILRQAESPRPAPFVTGSGNAHAQIATLARELAHTFSSPFHGYPPISTAFPPIRVPAIFPLSAFCLTIPADTCFSTHDHLGRLQGNRQAASGHRSRHRRLRQIEEGWRAELLNIIDNGDVKAFEIFIAHKCLAHIFRALVPR